jgi:hypothetical protein
LCKLETGTVIFKLIAEHHDQTASFITGVLDIGSTLEIPIKRLSVAELEQI